VLARGKPTVPAKRAASPGAPLPTTLGTASGQAEGGEVPRARSPVRGTIAIVMIAAAVTAVISTRSLGGRDAAVVADAAVPVVEVTVSPPEPEPEAEPEPVADAISSVGALVEIAVVAKQPTPARQTSTRPRPRPTPRRVTPPTAPPEDLYDTR
jgi:hypothetical protein